MTTRNKQTTFSQKPGLPQFRKYHDSSLDADDTESELVAIPESDQSDSTLHGGSAPVYTFHIKIRNRELQLHVHRALLMTHSISKKWLHRSGQRFSREKMHK